jgi:hypothetical protein
VHLSTGEKLTGTPNHPVFTQRGWVALGELDEINDRVGRFIGNVFPASLSVVTNDIENVPATFEEVFNLVRLSASGFRIRPVLEANFHGDGSGGDIDVVSVDGKLRDRFQAAFLEKFGKDALAATDEEKSRLLRSRFFGHGGIALDGATPSKIGRPGDALPLLWSPDCVSPELFLTSSPGDSSSLGDVEDAHPGDAVSLGDAGRALSRAIGFSNIVLKRTFDFCGHVYNLQTLHGWYEANGIIAHNCPVNTTTGLDIIAKSMAAIEQWGTDPLEKTMMAGSSIAAPVGGPTPGDGFALRRESLEGDTKNTAGPPKPRKKRRRRLSKAEALEIIRERYPSLDGEAVERVWQFASRTLKGE